MAILIAKEVGDILTRDHPSRRVRRVDNHAANGIDYLVTSFQT